MKRLLFNPLAACMVLGLGWAGGSAQAQVSTCTSFTVNSVSGIFTGAQLNIDGNISLTCNYVSGTRNQTIYIGIDEGELPAGRLLTRQTGTQTLAYAILRPNNYTGNWTTAQGRNLNNNQNGGLNATFNYPAGTNTLTQNYVYRLRVAAGTLPVPGVYDDSAVGVFARQTNQGGALRASTTFAATVSVLSQCFFSTAPAALSMNYVSFSSTASTGNTSFAVTCTQTTPYTMALDATSGTLLGLNYTLALPVTSGAGTAFPQNYVVNGAIAAGQAGTCATANCSATQARTLTITY